MGPRGNPLLVLALALALAGCAARSTNRTVVFWQFSPLTAILPVLDRFHREHPGIDVKVEQLTWQSGREKIVAAIAAGHPPDLAELGSTFLPGLVADSTLIDLTDSIPDLAGTLRGWPVTVYRGRAYAIPWMLGTRAMFVNTNLLKRAGLSPEKPPATWVEFGQAVARIDALGGGIKGFGMNSGEREVLFKKFMPFAWGNGGSILDSTMTKSVVASPQNIEALRWYLTLKAHSLLDRQEMLDEAFTRGRVGFAISGPWMLRKLPESEPTVHFTVTLMPRPAASKGIPASFAGAEALGIFRGSKEKAAALTLARFLCREENAMPLYVATGNAFPAAYAAERDPYFVSHPLDKVFVKQLETAVAPPVHPRWVEIEEILNAELEEAIYGKKSPEEALNSADKRIQALLGAPS